MNYHNFNIFNTYQNFTTIPSLFPEENINIIFKTFEGKENLIYFPSNTTVHQAFKHYLIRTGKYIGLSIEQKNKITFIYNARKFNYFDERTIGNVFDYKDNITIDVNFPENVNYNNNCNICNLDLNTIGISDNYNDNYQLNESIINKYKYQLNEEKNKNKKLKIENDNLRQELMELKNKKKEYLLTEINTNILNVIFETWANNDIHGYKIKCKNTDLFIRLEEKLYKDFPYLKNAKPCFFIKDRNIERFKNMDENKIKNNDIISIYIFGK